MNKKTWTLVGLAAVALAVCAYSAFKTMSPEGDVQSNVSEIAKSIDNTKGNTPPCLPSAWHLGGAGLRWGSSQAPLPPVDKGKGA